MNEIVFDISPEMEGERIDKCICGYLDSLSRSYIQKIIKDGNVFVNGKSVKSNYKVRVEDQIRFQIPDAVVVDGVTYQVVSVAPKAFKGNKNVKKVTLGKNVKTIGKSAFENCKNLKKITIQSTRLTKKSIGKNALKGTKQKVLPLIKNLPTVFLNSRDCLKQLKKLKDL